MARDRPDGLISSATYGIDISWSYSEAKWKRIAHTLGVDSSNSRIRNQITDAAQHYQGRRKAEANRPTPGEIRKELRRFSRHFDKFFDDNLRDSKISILGLSEEARTELDNCGMHLDGNPVTTRVRMAFKLLDDVQRVLRKSANTPAMRGRPSTKARKFFIVELVEIWNLRYPHATASRRRSTNTKGPRFLDFVIACIRPLDESVAGLDDDMKFAIAEVKKRQNLVKKRSD